MPYIYLHKHQKQYSLLSLNVVSIKCNSCCKWMNNNHKLTFQTALPLFPALWSDSHSFLVNKILRTFNSMSMGSSSLACCLTHTNTHTAWDWLSKSERPPRPHLYEIRKREREKRERERASERASERIYLMIFLLMHHHKTHTHTHTHTHTQSLTFVDAITGSQIMLQAMQIVKNYWNKKKEFERKKVGEKWRG